MLDFGETVNAFLGAFFGKKGRKMIFMQSVNERYKIPGNFYKRQLQKLLIFDRIVSFWRVFPC